MAARKSTSVWLGGVCALAAWWAQGSVTAVAEPAPASALPLSQYRVFGFNNLGMHCYDSDFSVFSLLPPFNVVHAQVIEPGPRPRLLSGEKVAVSYLAKMDRNGSINTSSALKTNYWDYAQALYGVQNPVVDVGILGAKMPGRSNRPQPMTFDAKTRWFGAMGIPVTNFDDRGQFNAYPLMRIEAVGSKGPAMKSSLDVVVPASSEMNCISCHVTGQDGASDWHATTYNVTFSQNGDPSIQFRENILLLHDGINHTSLFNAYSDKTTGKPVLCASCHYSKALDLNNTGPTGSQVGHIELSHAVHGHHGRNLQHTVPTDTAPAILPENGAASCYNCHPGDSTNCLRGAMGASGIVCQNCHGGMLSLGAQYPLTTGAARRPWVDLPKCQSCHTGDALAHLGAAIRSRTAYADSDPAATPVLATNQRFAENPQSLYRLSAGHGGVACASCHGSPHAEWPARDAQSNDNLTAKQIQGHLGPIAECAVCHGSGLLPTMKGPHGMHNVNDTKWIVAHGVFYMKNKKTACQPCHGADLKGSVLSAAAADRVFYAGMRGSHHRRSRTAGLLQPLPQASLIGPAKAALRRSVRSSETAVTDNASRVRGGLDMGHRGDHSTSMRGRSVGVSFVDPSTSVSEICARIATMSYCGISALAHAKKAGAFGTRASGLPRLSQSFT